MIPPHTTAFTVSVDFKHGTTTGISADDRTLTVRNLANGNVGASDFVRPGHIFPLVAREGGVLMRSGHTEAAVDLCKLAGLPPIGVISELVNDDGTVKRGPQVAAFAAEHGLKQVSVADLIAYRQRKETLIERVACSDIETPGGKAKAYHLHACRGTSMHHLAMVFGDIRDGEDVPVRLHSEDVVSDVFGTGHRLDEIMKSMGEQRRGVIVYLREGSVGVAHQAPQPAGDRGRRGPRGSAPARERMARDRPRRADPQGSRHFLDQPDRLARAPLCRPGRVRHQDRQDGDSLKRRRGVERFRRQQYRKLALRGGAARLRWPSRAVSSATPPAATETQKPLPAPNCVDHPARDERADAPCRCRCPSSPR